MCATVHNWCTRRGIGRFRLANNGDDCMVVMERGSEKRFRLGLVDYYKTLGFTMKVEPTVDVLERIEFCQTRPILVGENYRMIRNLHQSLSKDLHSLNDLQGDGAAAQWADAVGKGGRVLNDGVPVMKEFFKQFPTSTAARHNSDLAQSLEEANKYKFSREGKFLDLLPTPESRFSFWLAFGITPDEQVALEAGFQPLLMEPRLDEPEEVPTLLQFSRA